GSCTAYDFGFAGDSKTASSNVRTWTGEDPVLKNTVPSSSNYEAMQTKGDSLQIMYGDKGQWVTKVTKESSSYYAYMVINVKPSEFLQKLLANSKITVKAYVTANVTTNRVVDYNKAALTGTRYGEIFYGVKATSGAWTSKVDGGTAATNLPNQTSILTTDKHTTQNQEWSNAAITTGTTTFSSTNTNLVIGFGMHWGSTATTKERSITVTNISIHYTIEHNAGTADGSSTKIDDGGAPAKVSTIYGEDKATHANATSTSSAIEYYNPYRTSATSSWPLYYSTIADDLKEAIDNKDTTGTTVAGDWTLSAYVSSKLNANSLSSTYYGWGTSNFEYYKMATIDFADTFDYSYGGGFDSTKYKNNTTTNNTAGTAKGYRTVAGVGGFSLATGNAPSAITSTTDQSVVVASGLKNISIKLSTTDGKTSNTVSQNMWNLSDPSNANSPTWSSVYNLSVSGTVVGKVAIGRSSRARARVSVWVMDNATVEITVTDYGDRACSSKTYFKGIDTKAPTSNISLEYTAGTGSYVNNNIANIENVNSKWFRTNLFAPTVNSASEDLGDGATPYVWFYTVQRADTLAGLGEPYAFSAYRDSNNQGIYQYRSTMLPIAYGSFTQFEYDFENGGAKGYKSTTYNVPNPSISTEPTFKHTSANGVTDYKPRGDGYYRFNFYIADAAGNLRADYISSYYVKVDMHSPDASTNLSYTYDGEEHFSITPDDFNNFQWTNSPNPILKWSTAETKFSIIVNNANFAGNTLLFYSGQTGNTAHFLYFTRDGIKSLTGVGSPNADTGKYTLKITTAAGQNEVYISYSVRMLDADGNELPADTEKHLIANYEATLTFEFEGVNDEGVYPNVAWVSRFILYAGKYSSATEIENDRELDLESYTWFDSAWGVNHDGEVHIFIDRNLPNKPELEVTVQGDYLVNNAEYNFDDIVRNWYLSYTLPVKMSTEDDIGRLDAYGWGVRVYRGVKHITTRDELAQLQSLNIEDNYININSNNINTDYDGWFTAFGTYPYADWAKNFDLELLAGSGSGMRVIYLWMVDQAGQVSALQTYYILTDDRTYTVNSSVFTNNAFSAKEATVAQGKYADEKVTAGVKNFRRGETVHFTLSLTEGGGYVPYLFKMNGTPVFANYSALKDISAVDDDENSLAKVLETPYREGKEGSDTYIVTYKLDSADSLARLDTTINFELSDRFVVTYVYGTNSVTYSALPANVTVVDLNEPKALSHFQYVFVDNDNNVLYATADGGYTIDLEDALIENDEPVLFSAVNAGEYKVRIFIPKDDDTYVTSDYMFDEETGEQTFDPYTFYIEQGVVTITPVATTSIYGDDIVLEYTYTVTNDVNVNRDGERLVGALRLRTPAGVNWAINALIDVNSYEIIQDENNEFRVNDNFRISFTPAVFHQITAREVNIVAWSDTKSYGDIYTDFLFGVETSQFGWYTRRGGGFKVENVLADIFELYKASTSAEVEDYKLYEAGDLLSCTAGRFSDVGDYPIIADANAFTTNSRNYTIAIDVENKNLTVVQRTVTLDVSGQFTVVGQGTHINTSAVRPTFSIDPNDEHLRAQINEQVAGQITIDSVANAGTTWPDDYSGMEWYQIMLGDVDSDNIRIVLGGDTRYIVYFAGADAILIGIAEGATFSLPFGTSYTSDLITFSKFASNFVVQNIEADEYDRIEWDFVIANASLNGIISTGGHQVTISNIKVYKNNTEINRMAFADSFNLTITPSTIIVRPTVKPADGYTAMHKTYGDLESV
ncbi:MAG: hypothetical protein K2M36_04530, partial [Clostridia bacterium]|nr:hypothetical protein [Clostridia bacterium]